MNVKDLASELTIDPLDRGYAAMSDVEAAADLNTVNRSRNTESLTGDKVFAATSGAEFAALTDSKKQLWLAFCGRADIDPWGAANVAFVSWVFGAGSDTVASLGQLRSEDVSRATELGFGTIFGAHVTQARAE